MPAAFWLLVLLALAPFEVSAQEPDAEAASAPGESAAPVLGEVVITGDEPEDAPAGGTRLDEEDLTRGGAAAADTARLLEGVSGVSLQGAGGISSLPAIHGMADDRLRVQVDGMDLASACPNHMNSPLSYISPARVRSATVFAGITPVSVGGNSIGGTIQIDSAPPEFASGAGEILTRARAGSFFRSNGEGFGYDFSAAVAGRDLQLSYAESTAQSDNYSAADDFKPSRRAAPLRGWLDGKDVGSSAFDAATHRGIGLALRREQHLLQLDLGRQRVGFEGFPNQRMDMTDNQNSLVNLRYTGNFAWGELELRAFEQHTRHEMDMGPERFLYGWGMPMKSKAKTRGLQAKGSIEISAGQTLILGGDHQTYRLDDGWPPVGASGAMCCDEFDNVRDGEQDRTGIHAEWESRWDERWLTSLGIRSDLVASDAGRVQGYNESMPGWTLDAAAFNARDRRRTDTHLDLTALVRHVPHERLAIEGGYARKTRSPNLYERYAWSTNAMAALMNNLVGDGNGYIGRVDLRPEVAHTFSASVDLHDPDERVWSLEWTGYLTRIHDYIDVRRCGFGQCSAANPTATHAFVFLQYANEAASIYGIDVSGRWLLGRSDRLGSFTLGAGLHLIRGRNRHTGDDLHRMLPPSGELSLVHDLGRWSNAIEFSAVGSKTRLSSVRNEIPTGNDSLVDLSTRYELDHLRIELEIENLFDRFYATPLGGAYLGNGMSMSSHTLPWGIAVPGPGRSINVSLSVDF